LLLFFRFIVYSLVIYERKEIIYPHLPLSLKLFFIQYVTSKVVNHINLCVFVCVSSGGDGEKGYKTRELRIFQSDKQSNGY
jgi:hypothetical protein